MNGLWKTALQCALLSMAPVVELRGALPWAIAHGLPVWLSYLLCVFCNMIPVPFILLFIKKILEWMKTRRRLAKYALWLEDHAQKKLDVYYKYKLLGLFILVAIPLPGTGAWTGALVASLLGVEWKQAMLMILLGVAAAGAIVLAVSLGAVAVFG